MTAEEFADAIGRVLAGAELRAVGRSAGTGIVELVGPGSGAIAIHIQCPFRLVREERILLGSDDMNVSKRSDPNAFDNFETFFDSRSTAINELIAKFYPTVSGVTVGVVADGDRLEGSSAGGFSEFFRLARGLADL